MLQKATPLRKSAPWPPNISHETCLFVLRLPRKNASLQILFKCPTPAMVFWKCDKTLTFCSLFDKVHNPLRLPRETTSETPKVARACGVLYILTSKCASRHYGVHFFDIAPSKSGPTLVCFCTFWLPNVLRATTPCTFSTSQLLKVVWSWCVLYILTWECASRHNGVQFFISYLARWLRTRRFSEPTFWPSGAPNHWKTQCFATFLPFRAAASSIFWGFLFLLSLLFSDSSHLCFSSVHIIGSFDF